MNDYETNIPYIVELKEDINNNQIMYTTLKKHVFCGFLVNNNGSNLYFELNGSRMLVIIPHDWINFMAPSALHYQNYTEENAEEDNNG